MSQYWDNFKEGLQEELDLIDNLEEQLGFATDILDETRRQLTDYDDADLYDTETLTGDIAEDNKRVTTIKLQTLEKVLEITVSDMQVILNERKDQINQELLWIERREERE